MSLPLRVLVFAPYNAYRTRHMALLYDFGQVIAASDDAHILAPDAPDSRLLVELDRAASLVSRQLKLGPRAHIAPATVDQDYDLMVALFSFPREAIELSRVKHWRARCKKAVALVNETWPWAVEEVGPAQEVLAQFDHLYCAVEGTEQICAAKFGRPVSLMASGADTLAAKPIGLPRIYDVYAMGRSPPALTNELRAAQRAGALSFLFDVNGAPFTISDYPAHRDHKITTLQRTRYLPCYAVNAFDNRKKEEAGAFDVVPWRFFEGAASGCVLFGVPPTTAVFKRQFPWQDVLIPCPADQVGFLEFFQALDREPDRLNAIRAANVVGSLRNNDWVYRYENILADIGLQPSAHVNARKQLLADAAQAIEVHGLPASLPGVLAGA
jgi:hypothetical protein